MESMPPPIAWSLLGLALAAALFGAIYGLRCVPTCPAPPSLDVPEPLPVGDPPDNVTVAFLGDQGVNADARAVLEMVEANGTDLVVHGGDLGYGAGAAEWDRQINATLGPDFPYIAAVGNHDADRWPAYQARLRARADRAENLTCRGDLGVRSVCVYQGIVVLPSGVGTMGRSHGAYLHRALTQHNATWEVCTWHKNQRPMQVGEKASMTGWGVYETCRSAGALVQTAHSHTYSRTYLMSSFRRGTVVSNNETLHVEGGRSIAFVSGLGGKSIRGHDPTLADNPWWAAIASADTGADYGALICTFDGKRADCAFRMVDGRVADRFTLVSDDPV